MGDSTASSGGQVDSKGLVAAGAAVFGLCAVLVVLSYEERWLALPLALAAGAFASLVPVWPTVGKWHAIASLAVLGGAAGYLSGEGTAMLVASLFLLAGAVGLIAFFVAEDKRRKSSTT